mgnify:CR=1 FL=1
MATATLLLPARSRLAAAALPEDVAKKVARDNFLAILPRTELKSEKTTLNR